MVLDIVKVQYHENYFNDISLRGRSLHKKRNWSYALTCQIDKLSTEQKNWK